MLIVLGVNLFPSQARQIRRDPAPPDTTSRAARTGAWTTF